MRRAVSVILALFLTTLLSAQTAGYTEFVNPMVGTDGHGHTFPGAAYPFGMVQLSPDTRPLPGNWDGCSGYHYSDSLIYGFSHTHLSGTGCDDLCDVLLMPVRDYNGGLDRDKYCSSFSHGREKASPGYYEVYLEDPKVNARMTVGRRFGVHEYGYEGTGKQQLIIDLKHRDYLTSSRIYRKDEHTIEGYRVSRSWADNQHVHFSIVFDRPISSFERYGDEGALITFGGSGNTVTAHVGISSTSEDNAYANLMDGASLSDGSLKSFDSVRSEARAEWNSYLSKIEVEGGSFEQLRTFYTALYHTAIHPSLYSDANGDYLGMDRKIHNTAVDSDGNACEPYDRYTVFSIWDTFRALHPLFTIIERERTKDFLRSFQSIFDEAGKLPVWELYGHETNCMIGYNSASVILDAFAKGISGVDYERLLEAMLESSKKHEYGLDSFYADGAVLADKEHESVSKTLEYAYDAWCVSTLARAFASRNDEYAIAADEYYAYAQQWINVLDPQTGFMRPRLNGRWLTPFAPTEVNNHFTEANSWQYSFFVPHDVEGHIRSLGGDLAYSRKIDELFSASERTTGRTQADITGLIGQYAHGNEPSHHIPYLYCYAGQPWKTQERVHGILTSLYSDGPEGLCGNEDCGQMSAWYVMSSLGLYSVCPGKPDYVLTSPLFRKAVVHLESGNDFTVSSSGDSFYVASASLAGKSLNRSFITMDEILAGGSLDYVLSDIPSEDFGVSYGNRPHSSMERWIITPPSFLMENDIFLDSVEVAITDAAEGGYVEYAVIPEGLDMSKAFESGSGDAIRFRRYTAPFSVDESCTILAHNVQDGNLSPMVECKLHRIHRDRKIDIRSHYNPQYNAGGDDGLIDGARGSSPNWRTGGWQGYQDTDFEAVVDLLQAENLKSVGAGFFQDARSWIWMPRYVDFYFAGPDADPEDDSSFRHAGRVENTVGEQDYELQTRDFVLVPEGTSGDRVRYVKVVAKNFGTIPEWHPGAGGEGFIFVDEILIEKK